MTVLINGYLWTNANFIGGKAKLVVPEKLAQAAMDEDTKKEFDEYQLGREVGAVTADQIKKIKQSEPKNMSYRRDGTWLDRWFELTGNRPDPSLLGQRKINGSTKGDTGRTLRDDAALFRSRQFIRRGPT